MKTVLLYFLSLILLITQVNSKNCVFIGTDNGSSWSQPNNWSCNSIPNPLSDHITIPRDYSVVYDLKKPIEIGKSKRFVIEGMLNLQGNNIVVTSSWGNFSVLPEASLYDVKNLFLVDNSSINIDKDAIVIVRHLKVSKNSILHTNGARIIVTQKLEIPPENNNCIQFTPYDEGQQFMRVINTPPVGLVKPSCEAALPVLFNHLIVEEIDGEVNIEWSTNMESSSEEYIVQRNREGNSQWVSIDTIEASKKHYGLSLYDYKDKDVFSGEAKYRVALKDTKGNMFYSEEKSIDRLKTVENAIVMYFNQVHDIVYVQAKDGIDQDNVYLFDMLQDDLPLNVEIANIEEKCITISTEHLDEGAYYLQYKDHVQIFYKRF